MPQKQHERNILLLTEAEHADFYKVFLDANPSIAEEGFLLISLDAETEQVLSKRGIEFVSGRNYRTPDTSFCVLSEEWPAALFESKEWDFFTYRGVSLGQLYFLPLQSYLSHLLYYVDIAANLVARHPSAGRFVVFPPAKAAPPRGSTLIAQKMSVVVDAVSHVAAHSGKEVLVPAMPTPMSQKLALPFFFKRALFGFAIGVMNIVISAASRPRSVRILASDYWKNLSPYVKNIDSAEIILIDRTEALNAGLKNIWKYRMRFLHISAFCAAATARKAAQERIAREWRSVTEKGDAGRFMFRGVSLQPLVFRALDGIVEEVTAKILKDIDDTHAMLEKLKPGIVALRSTVSAQTHFVILAHVARAQGIPSVEMQHGLEYYGPGSVSKRHRAEFTAVYGPLTKKQMQEAGDTQTTPVVIGSPRFDAYAAAREAPVGRARESGVSILCIAPAIDPGGDSPDSYDALDYYSAIASAVKKIPDVSVVIKFRPGPDRDPFVRAILASLFEGVPYAIAQREPLSELYPRSDIVVSCYSTAAIEALQCGKPLIYLGLSPVQALMGKHHFSYYVQQGAMHIADTKEALAEIVRTLSGSPDARKDLSRRALQFLKQEYLFDGNAGKRAARWLESLAAGRR